MAGNYSLLSDTEPLMDDVEFSDPEPATFTARGSAVTSEHVRGDSPSDCDPLDIEPHVHGARKKLNGARVEYSNGDEGISSALSESHRTLVGVNRDYASDVVINLPRQSSVPEYYASRETEENVKCVVSSVLFMSIVVAVIVYMFVFNPQM